MKTDWQLLIHLSLEFKTNYYKHVTAKPKQTTLSFMKNKDLVLLFVWNVLLEQVILNFAKNQVTKKPSTKQTPFLFLNI